MSVFEDVSRFLETRLEEFLRNNPHLELEAIDEQLREQEQDTLRLIRDGEQQEKKLQNEILATAKDIQIWHSRIDKARAAGRNDLADGAQEREAALLRQGNQLWGQMQGCKQRIEKAKELQRQIQIRREEVKVKVAQSQATKAKTQAQKPRETTGWNQTYNRQVNSNNDSLEQTFRRWEADEELEKLKRNMGR